MALKTIRRSSAMFMPEKKFIASSVGLPCPAVSLNMFGLPIPGAVASGFRNCGGR